MALKESIGRRQPKARFFQDEEGNRYRLLKAYDDPPVFRVTGPLSEDVGAVQPILTVMDKSEIHDCRNWAAAQGMLAGELARRRREAPNDPDGGVSLPTLR